MTALDTALRAMRAASLGAEKRAHKAILAAWKRALDNLRPYITAAIAQAIATQASLPPGATFAVAALPTVRALQAALQMEMRTFALVASTAVVAGQSAAMASAPALAAEAVLAALGTPPAGVLVPNIAASALFVPNESAAQIAATIARIAPGMGDAGARAIAEGVRAGKSPRAIAADVRRVTSVAPTRALVISRHAVNEGFRRSAIASYKASGVVVGYRRLSARNRRTCAACFVPGTLVSGPRPEKVFSRHYAGDVVTIKTASGKEITATPNHPILTSKGWVPIGLLQEGGNVVCSTSAERTTFGVNIDNHDVPTPIEQVAESFGMVPAEMECAAPDFHGDGEGSKVYVVWSDRLLGNDRDATLGEHGVQGLLGGRLPRPKVTLGALFPLLCCDDTLLQCLDIPAGMILPDNLAVLQGDGGGTEGIGLGGRSAGHASESQTSGYGRPVDTKRLSQSIFGFPGQITASNLSVIETERIMLPFGGGLKLGVSGFGPEQIALMQNGKQPFVVDAACSRGVFGGESAPICADCLFEITLPVKVPPVFGDGDPTRDERAPDGFMAHAVELADSGDRLTGKVTLDYVVSVGRRAFSGHVYNLQTEDEWYFANGIIAHNCWALDGKEYPLDEPFYTHACCRCCPIPIVRDSTVALPVDGPTAFEALSAEDQRFILGSGKYDLWKSGSIALSDLASDTFSPVYGRGIRETSLRELKAS